MTGNLKFLLNQLTTIEGVRTAVVASRDGFVIEAAGSNQVDFEAVGAVIATGLGSTEVMGTQVGVGPMLQALIEYDSGIIVMSTVAKDAILALVVDGTANLGNVRYQVKKAAPAFAQAL